MKHAMIADYEHYKNGQRWYVYEEGKDEQIYFSTLDECEKYLKEFKHDVFDFVREYEKEYEQLREEIRECTIN